MFEQLKNLRQMANLLGNASQMRDKMEAMQDQLRSQTVTGHEGGVEVDANGLGDILAVRIDPNLLSPARKIELEGILPRAIDQAIRKSKEQHVEAMAAMTEGLPIPGMQEALRSFVDGGKPA